MYEYECIYKEDSAQRDNNDVPKNEKVKATKHDYYFLYTFSSSYRNENKKKGS